MDETNKTTETSEVEPEVKQSLDPILIENNNDGSQIKEEIQSSITKIEQCHDPREFIRGLQQILISGTKRIGFLCGAGTSMATPMTDKNGNIVLQGSQRVTPLIPGVNEMTEIIVAKITEIKYANAIVKIKEELSEGIKDPKRRESLVMLENIISSIDQKIRVVGKETLCGLDKDGLIDLRKKIITEIKNIVSVHDNEEIKLETKHLVHLDFARYIKYATRKFPIEVFTTNYDYLFEYAFEENFVPYFDGFVGGFNPFFDPVSVENDNSIPQWTRLWKLHGSLGWKYSEHEKRIVRSREKSDDSIVIYPSLLKYDDSRKQPYSSYIDRLSQFIKRDDGVLFICGYSFGDDHINETIMNALSQTRSSTVIALYFDKDLTQESSVINLANRSNKIIVCGNNSALIGGIFAEWKLKREPSNDEFEIIDQFFDVFAPEPKLEKGKGDEPSTLKGELCLVDFSKFVKFLISLTYPTALNYD